MVSGAAYTSGISGQAVNLSGSAHVDISKFTVFNNMAAFTLSAWIYPASIRAMMNSMIAKVNPNWDFVLYLDGTGKLSVHFAINGNQYYGCTADTPVSLNQWTHVAAVWTGSRWRLFQNGALVKESPYVSGGAKPSWTGTVMEI